jgi:hypothetical protein
MRLRSDSHLLWRSWAEFLVVGEELEFGLVGERVASILPLFVFCLLVNGGPEEPGWRGFAMPRLQERFTPVKATLIFGPIWGLWHLPLLLAESNVDHDLAAVPFVGMLLWTLAGFSAYAITYTYLWNRTGSVFLCTTRSSVRFDKQSVPCISWTTLVMPPCQRSPRAERAAKGIRTVTLRAPVAGSPGRA